MFFVECCLHVGSSPPIYYSKDINIFSLLEYTFVSVLTIYFCMEFFKMIFFLECIKTGIASVAKSVHDEKCEKFLREFKKKTFNFRIW